MLKQALRRGDRRSSRRFRSTACASPTSKSAGRTRRSTTAVGREPARDLRLRPRSTGQHQPACARRIITSLARRAFRRPVSAREIGPVRRAGARGAEAGAVVRRGARGRHPGAAGLARLPVPHRARSAGSAATRDLAPDHAARAGVAAVVLPLGEHAGRGAARAPPTPARCAIPRCSRRRCAACCAIRRSRALVENFGGQWLQFRALESVTRDRERFPDFDDYLRLSMRRETELFVEHIIREDRSILDFIDGRYSFLNERLARHYGIPNVAGPGVPPRRSHRARRAAASSRRPAC